MKKIVLLASAILAFASCANDNYLGTEDEQRFAQGEKPITFGFDVPAATRAEGAAAATALGNQFIVYGEKSETADGAAPVTNGSTIHQLVFPNYQVNYAASSAYTTTSNTKDWEYVGYTHSTNYQSNIQTKKGDAAAANANAETQTIKYWDYSATNYVFTAFSAKQEDIENGNVKVTKITEKTDGNKVYDKGYTVVLKAAADPTKLYFSDRQVINTKNTTVNREAQNEIGGNVKLTFRSGVSQIRAAMYENIPGYTVTIDKFYYADDADPEFSAMTTAKTDKFYANVPNVTTDKGATLTVTYYKDGTRQNQPTIAVSGADVNKFLTLGENLKGSTLLGENIGAAVYDKSDKSFTSVFPQETNDKNLKLKLDYTLTSPVTGETIHVTGATAEVPAAYLQWKPNFKYTYIFKISDNTNGYTGGDSNPAGLYPITFDAIEVVAEDGQAEYITTVSEPSITTFGVKENKYVVDAEEYTAGSDIYATFMEGSTAKTPELGGSGAQHVNVYTVSSDDDTNFPVTEASVAEAIENGPSSITNPIYTYDDGTDTYTPVANVSDLARGTTYYKKDASDVAPGDPGYTLTLAIDGTDYNIASVVKYTAYTTNVTLQATVPTEDNKTITLANSAKALKMASVAAGTYAIEYEASAAWTGKYKKVYKVIKVQ